MKDKHNVNKIGICALMKQDYADYAMSVITDRALADIRDGLKPVQRRILYSMRNVKDYTKSARIVGAVLGKYHPHGDTAVYDAMVRLAQDFNMLTPWVSGHGNFGSIDGDSAAAMRYTECKARDDMSNIYFKYNLNGIEYKDNYDGKEKEPIFLSAPFPTILVNNVNGIAVGYACNIPSHNINEVINTYKAYVEKKLTTNNIRRYLKGPDFPIKFNIVDNGAIDQAYATGRGSFMCNSIYEEEPGSYGRKVLVIKSVLPTRSKEKEILKIGKLYKDDKSDIKDIITKISDQSAANDIRIVITLRKGVSIKTAIESFAKKDIFFDRFKYTANIIVNGEPRTMGIMDIMSEFHKHHSSVIHKDLAVRIATKEEELHMLNGLNIILTNLEKAISLIVSIEDKDVLRKRMKQSFPKLDNAQLEYVLDMKIRSLMGKKKSIKASIREVKAEMRELKNKSNHVDDVILEQLQECKKDFRKHKRICPIYHVDKPVNKSSRTK